MKPKKPKIFLAISYTKKRKVENAIRKFFETKGFEVITGRNIGSGQYIDEEIKELIRGCDYGAVVYNELRHNISYEWGFMDAILDKEKIFLFKDENIHIDLDKELSDKKGINYTPFCGEDNESEIIESLMKNEGLMRAIEKSIKISKEQTEDTEKATKLLAKSDLPLTGITEKEIPIKNLNEIISTLDNIKLTSEGHLYKGNALYYAKRYEKAKKEYRKALKANPNYAEAHNNLGILLDDLKRYKEAEKEYREAIRINPNYATAHYNLGILLKNLKRYKEAEKEYREAIRINPNLAEAHVNLGILFAVLKRYEEAEKEYREALRINPNLAEAHVNLGILFAELKRYEEAEKEYKEAIRINPNDAGAHNNLGNLLADLKRYEEAEKEYREALRINPNDAKAHNNLGILFAELKRYEEAEKEYKEALRINPNDADAYYNFACLYSLRNNLKNAIEYLKKAIEIDKKYKEKAKEDKDFDNIRETKEFREIINNKKQK